MTLSAFATRTRRAAWAGFVVLCLALLVLGCSTTRTVTVPAVDPTVMPHRTDFTRHGAIEQATHQS